MSAEKEQSTRKRWIKTEIDEILPELPAPLIHVGPKHPSWMKRVKLENIIFENYIKYLIAHNISPWINIIHSDDPADKGFVWEGSVWMPQNPRINFSLIILVPSNYPIVPPRAFLEDTIMEYVQKKIYVGGKLERHGKKYVMLCHDHLKEIENIWKPTYTLTHFIIHEVWYWWNAMVGEIEKVWNERHKF
ncbi:MAG: hypothetical protein QXL15_04570 [Candidatus Korarchaeota archaeon]